MLKEFLTNIANAFRSALGTTETINAQDFADKVNEVFEAGKAQGGGDAQMLIDKMAIRDFAWQNEAFPEGYELVLNFKKTNGNNNTHSLNAVLYGTTGIKTVTLICEESGTIPMGQFVRASSVEVVDITNFKRIPTEISYMAMANTKLVSILGELDMSRCTKATHPFNTTTALEEIRFKEGTIGISLDFHWSTKLSAESYDSIIKGHSKEVSVTLTLPAEATVRSVYDAKNGAGAWDAITAEYSNVTIEYK